MADRQTPRREPVAPVLHVPENVADFYANAVSVASTPWDFMLLFGSNVLPSTLPAGRGSHTVPGSIRIDAVIRMSPQHAKATLRALERVMTAYEQQHGEVSIPPEGGEENTT